MTHKEKMYTKWSGLDDMVSFEVAEKQTDLFILAEKKLKNKARAAILTYRAHIESYIKKDKRFFYSLEPIEVEKSAPDIVKHMASAAKKAGVGPMAGAAGAIAEFVGRDLLNFSDQVMVENGSNIFIKSSKPSRLKIFTGDDSSAGGAVTIEVPASKKGLGICVSSGTASDSLSFGKADAVIIVSDNTALADAVATASGNIVKGASDIGKAVQFAKSVNGIKGVLILAGNKVGSWGDVKLA